MECIDAWNILSGLVAQTHDQLVFGAGGSKLKDWDREADSDDALPEEQFEDMAGDSD